MSLEQARTKLSEALRDTDLENLGADIDEAFVQTIDDWFVELKGEEGRDTFAAAFQAHRMTARVVKKKDQIIENISMNKYNLKTESGPKDKIGTKDVYNTGMSGMKLRTNPDNFGTEAVVAGGLKKIDGKFKMVPSSKKGKYNLGLHDLSAVLLSTKRGPILGQLAWKEGAKDPDTNAIAFMPLPLEADLKLFAVLSEKAKKHRAKHARIYSKVADVRHKWTRVKLANEVDAGSGFVNVGTGWNDKARKYRYGLGLIAIPEKTGAIGVLEMKRRQELALEYTSLLAKMKPMPETGNPTNNELVVAYRHHQTSCFPLFAEYDKEVKNWKVIDGPEGFSAQWIGTKVPAIINQDGTTA